MSVPGPIFPPRKNRWSKKENPRVSCRKYRAVSIYFADNTKLIIRSIPLNKLPATPFAVIHPFFSNKDRENINSKILAIKQLKRKKTFNEQIRHILNENHFEKNTRLNTKIKVLQHICSIMQKDGYVDNDFFPSVIERENMSSTAFEAAAIPHAIKMEAKKTGMFVLLAHAGIVWEKTTVKLVVLLTISKDDRKLFREVFDNLSTILTEHSHVAHLCAAKNYAEFVQILFNLEHA